MRTRVAIVVAIWAAAGCTVDGSAAAPTAAPPVTASAPIPTPAPTPTRTPLATRIAWPPMPQANQSVAVRVEPGVAAPAPSPPLIVATRDQLAPVAQEFLAHYTTSVGFLTTMQNIRTLAYHGSEPYMFANEFAPGPFADTVKELLTTPHPDETRRFVARSAALERGWMGPNGVAVVEGTVVFADEVTTATGVSAETHDWAIRAFRQFGNFYILDGTERGGGSLAPLQPFDARALDGELANQVSQYLGFEQASASGGRPVASYKGTPYWDARKGALDWLFMLAEQGVLTDRHFDGMTAQVTEFAPTTHIGDGIVTVRLRGTLIEVMNGTRRTYPVDEAVRFQRTAAAQAIWLAVDGKDDNGAWLNGGHYAVAPEPIQHG